MEQNTVDCLKQIQNKCYQLDISLRNDIYINSDTQNREPFIIEMLIKFNVYQGGHFWAISYWGGHLGFG